MRGAYRGVIAAVVVVILAVSACASDPRVVVHGASGDVAVTVELATTPTQQEIGLMYRKELAESAGMLFVFDQSVEHPFWMKNTVLPLDMIFLGDDRRIVGIVKNAAPFTTTPRTVGKPSRYVLEVNAGFSDKHGLGDGDQATFENVPGGAP